MNQVRTELREQSGSSSWRADLREQSGSSNQLHKNPAAHAALLALIHHNSHLGNSLYSLRGS